MQVAWIKIAARPRREDKCVVARHTTTLPKRLREMDAERDGAAAAGGLWRIDATSIEATSDRQALAAGVDVAPLEGECFADPQTALAEQFDQEPPAIGRVLYQRREFRLG